MELAQKLDSIRQAGLDRAHGPRLHGLVAAGSGDPGLFDREWTDVLWLASRFRPAGRRKARKPSATFGGRFGRGFAPSGNRAFDEYREETLRRLEDEQKEFKGFLDRLRQAKDKAEFDQFMAERRNRPAPAPEGSADTRPDPQN